MTFHVAGFGLIAVGVTYLAIKLRSVYRIARNAGSDGGVPTFDALMAPPILITIGVVFILDGLPVWIGLTMWAALVVAVLACLWLTFKLGVRDRSS